MKLQYLTLPLLVFGFAVTTPHAHAQASLGTNLILNGDAEIGAGSGNGSQVPVAGFVTTGTFTMATYGAAGGFPTTADPGPTSRGLNFFAGGPSAAVSTGSQSLDLAALSSFIDAGGITFDLAGYFGGFQSQRDNAVLSLTFLSGVGDTLGTFSIGGVTPTDRQNQTGLLLRDTFDSVPIGTRSAQITLTMTRLDGTYNDGYADNLSLVLSSVPESSTFGMYAFGLLAVALRALRSSAFRQGAA